VGITEEWQMKDFIVIIAIVVAWYVLNKYVLPRFGVKT
jgi:p-aminobenzoyl-glutamate transporter AbgT